MNIIYGTHAVLACLDNNPKSIKQILCNKLHPKVSQYASEHNIKLIQSSKKELDRLSGGANHQGIMAYVHATQKWAEADLPDLISDSASPFILILDGITDPHNLGACLRTADAVGVTCVIAPKDNAVGITPAVEKVASGATQTMPFIQVTNLARTLKFIKDQGIWIYGTAGEAKDSLYQTNLTGPVALVMGAEGKGLRRLTREHCDALINIPMHGQVESLNISVATGICLYEILRQR